MLDVPDGDAGASLTCAVCVNNQGLIAGCYRSPAGTAHLCVCDSTTRSVSVLADVGSINIRDMNSAGTVVGYVTNEAGGKHGP